MKKFLVTLAAGLLVGAVSSGQARDDTEHGRWVTFKVTHGDDGEMDHQIDRQSIHQEGPYRTFWTRMWIVRSHSALAFSPRPEALEFRSQKFAVDCAHAQFGTRLVDTNLASEFRARTSLQKMTWRPLGKSSPILVAVCGAR